MAIFLDLGQQRVTKVPCASPQRSVPSVLFMGSLYRMPTQQVGGHFAWNHRHVGKERSAPLWLVNRCIKCEDYLPSEPATTQSGGELHLVSAQLVFFRGWIFNLWDNQGLPPCGSTTCSQTHKYPILMAELINGGYPSFLEFETSILIEKTADSTYQSVVIRARSPN